MLVIQQALPLVPSIQHISNYKMDAVISYLQKTQNK